MVYLFGSHGRGPRFDPLCVHHLRSATCPFYNQSVCAKRLPDLVPMTPQKLIVLFTTLTGGAVGLFAPVGVVRWLLQTESEDAGILTLFFFPVWCLIFALGLLIGRRVGMVACDASKTQACSQAR